MGFRIGTRRIRLASDESGLKMSACRIMKCGIVPFCACQRCQRALATLRGSGAITDTLLLAEHPHTFAIGRNALPSHLIWDERECSDRGIAVCLADRGGGITYHGPGQLVAYPIIHLGEPPDLHRYLRNLEATVVLALAELGVEAQSRPGLTGVWVGDRKIASIGIKFSRGVARHGVSVNVTCDLSYFDGIVACGLEGVKQTSLASLGIDVSVEKVAETFAAAFCKVFALTPIDVESRFGNHSTASPQSFRTRRTQARCALDSRDHLQSWTR